jgi:hypothetical protein
MNISKSLILPILLSFSILAVLGARENDPSSKKSMNKAVQVEITKKTFARELIGINAPKGETFLILETQWENIHPKQKVEKDKLEGKTDRTMGVGALSGRKKKKETEYVDMDVAYQIGKFYDHAYLLADGIAYSLDKSTEKIPEGAQILQPFTIPKKGDIRAVNFVYSIPERAQNLSFLFFDYEYGHISIPVQGDPKTARGSGDLSGETLDFIQSDLLEVAAHSVSFFAEYAEMTVPDGWKYAVVQISGKSLSGGSVKDIIQIEPDEYTWVTTAGGYFYYAAGGSTSEEGMIRFTPEIFQHQEVAFLIPESEEVSQLGIRIRNDVFQLNLTDAKPKGLPKASATHTDGDVMEVSLFSLREDNGRYIVNLGIQSLTTSGIEIQAQQQFILEASGEQIFFSEEETDSLHRKPPTPFLIPPKSFVRFELSFESPSTPDSLYFRGYESEATFKLPSIDKKSKPSLKEVL